MTTDRKPTNIEIADELDRIADLLAAQDANRFRIQAYRDGAHTVRETEKSLAELVREQGEKALRSLPHIGWGIARVINTMVQAGRSAVLRRLEGEAEPGEIFTQIPGIGEELAERIVEELGVSTFEELEQAAHDGRLQQIGGFGPKRVRNIRISLAGMLNTAARRRAYGNGQARQRPTVATLLAIDKAYRKKAAAGELRQIAPRRFNPEGEAWLPIWHTEHGPWEFTVLYSNTARAHELGKTDDWVVIYYEQDGTEDQATAVTETRGPLEGKRVIRGRESETQRYYEQEKQKVPA